MTSTITYGVCTVFISLYINHFLTSVMLLQFHDFIQMCREILLFILYIEPAKILYHERFAVYAITTSLTLIL